MKVLALVLLAIASVHAMHDTSQLRHSNAHSVMHRMQAEIAGKGGGLVTSSNRRRVADSNLRKRTLV
jgi:hypothetical protein